MLVRIHEFLKLHGISSQIVGGLLITSHQTNEAQFQLSARLPTDFPRSLPWFHLLDRARFGALAHVAWTPDPKSAEEDSGLVCGGVSVSRSIDFDSPEQAFLKAMKQAADTVASSLRKDSQNEKDIQREFAGHWTSVVSDPKVRVVSFVERGTELREIQPFVCSEGPYRGDTILVDTKNPWRNDSYEFLRELRTKAQVLGKAVYFPIAQPKMPPSPGVSVMDWWTDCLNGQDIDMQGRLRALTRQIQAAVFWVLGSVKTVDDRSSWFAIRFKNSSKSGVPLTNGSLSGWTAEPHQVLVHNQEYLLPRGGASASRLAYKLAIIGCGSVGGEIARLIASSGVGELTLVDPEPFENENLYRHVLGSGRIGRNKAEALSEELQGKFPYIKVIAKKATRLEHCLDSDFLGHHGGIIVATGDTTAERYFDSKMREFATRPWVVYSWVEGLGVGGHAVYVHNSGAGCLGCLFRDTSGSRSLASIQNFIAPDQDLAIDISGCGTHFLPYSYADAVQSAILATRLAGRAIEGKLDHSCRLSWKGGEDLDEAIRTTYRFKKFRRSLEEEPLHWKDCDVCC